VLHRDETLLVVDKASGILTVGHPGGRDRCLLDDLRRDGHRVAPVHRLDRETSGVLLLSLDPERRAALEAAFRRHEVRKRYLALVHGVPATRRATIDVPILDEGSRARVDPRGRRAVSRYEVLEALSGRAALVRVELETGRHNQIRVHFAHLGHPLLGDRKYGLRPKASAGEPSRTMLHAELLQLRHPASGETLTVEAPPPSDFQDCLEALRGG
jgi:23S rRNA pseudouridine1911/1915/1917 synthase